MSDKSDQATITEGVLGIGKVRPDPPGPNKPRRGRGTPAGIEVREHATGIGDVPQRSGATGIDMGGGGEGTQVSDHSSRPAATETDEE